MTQKQFWQLILILFVLVWAIIEITPPTGRNVIEEFKNTARSKDEAFTNIVKEAERLQAIEAARTFANLRDAVGTNDLTRYFTFGEAKNAANPSAAILARLQKDCAGKIKLGLDLQGGTSFLVGFDISKLSTNVNQNDALVNAVEVLRKRVDKLGVAEPLIQPAGGDKILIQLPGLTQVDMDRAKEQIQKAAYLEFRMVHPDSFQLLSQGIVEPGYEVLKEERRGQTGTAPAEVRSYLVKKGAERGLTGANIKRAYPDRDQLSGEPQISFELDDVGARKFAEITQEWSPRGNRKYQMAIVLDGELSSAPEINGPITGGSAKITGKFTWREATDLAYVLENPLEAPVKIMEERTVDPTLGSDTIQSGMKAVYIGTAAVAGFMIIYYLFAGFVSTIALSLNILLLMACMCSAMFGGPFTFTMPGIAGVVLTIGMAVDANVLIFERIREELASGKSMRGALVAGYDKAFSTIFDSHITTLISSIILIVKGTGPIQGFGRTLTIGVAVSLFTALVVTRLIFDLLLSKNMLPRLSMLHLLRTTKVDFMRWAVPAFVASWILIFVGIGYGAYRGKDALGIEFSGGVEVTFAFKEKIPQDKLREAVHKLGFGEPMIQYQKSAAAGGSETVRVAVRVIDEAKTQETGNKVIEGVQKEFPQAGFNKIGVDSIGPTVGREIQKNAVVASLVALFGILVYVAFRYEFSFAVAAIVAILHDMLMTAGWFFLTGGQMSATWVAAMLTIIGFSINDTIVIFDRIREDLRTGRRGSFRELINHALNQTLSRTIITSGTVFLATMSLYLFGGAVIKDFAFTFLVGIITGTYSSIYIASTIVLKWHKGERPKLAAQVTMDNATEVRV